MQILQGYFNWIFVLFTGLIKNCEGNTQRKKVPREISLGTLEFDITFSL